MLIVQQNCGRGYEYIISALAATLGLGASVVWIQKLFVRNRSISHGGFFILLAFWF